MILMFNLKEKVRDVVTGLEGTIIQRVEYATGCVQYKIQPHGIDKEGGIRNPIQLDGSRLERIEPEVAPLITQPEFQFALESMVCDRVTGFSGVVMSRNDNIGTEGNFYGLYW